MYEILIQIARDENFKKERIVKLLISVRDKVSQEDRILIDLEIIDLWNKVKPHDLELVSNCCNAEVVENSDVCSDCKEHCEVSLEDLPFEYQVKIIEDAHYAK